MASTSSPALKRGHAGRSRQHAASHAVPRRGRRGSVTFDEKTSIYPFNANTDPQLQAGTLRTDQVEEEEEEDQSGSDNCYTCSTLVERRSFRRLFRVCAVVNLLSLAFSAPLRICNDEEESDCDGVFIQFLIITVVDFIVALVYTLHLALRIQYLVYHRYKKKASLIVMSL